MKGPINTGRRLHVVDYHLQVKDRFTHINGGQKVLRLPLKQQKNIRGLDSADVSKVTSVHPSGSLPELLAYSRKSQGVKSCCSTAGGESKPVKTGPGLFDMLRAGARMLCLTAQLHLCCPSLNL